MSSRLAGAPSHPACVILPWLLLPSFCPGSSLCVPPERTRVVTPACGSQVLSLHRRCSVIPCQGPVACEGTFTAPGPLCNKLPPHLVL